MSSIQINQIAGNGMDMERSRLELATIKLSLMNMSFSSSLEATDFLSQLGTLQNSLGGSIKDPAIAIKQITDANNPLADSDGLVYRFSIDPTKEMATLISATRAYEANVRAYNANGQMNRAALEIGAR